MYPLSQVPIKPVPNYPLCTAERTGFFDAVAPSIREMLEFVFKLTNSYDALSVCGVNDTAKCHETRRARVLSISLRIGSGYAYPGHRKPGPFLSAVPAHFFWARRQQGRAGYADRRVRRSHLPTKPTRSGRPAGEAVVYKSGLFCAQDFEGTE